MVLGIFDVQNDITLIQFNAGIQLLALTSKANFVLKKVFNKKIFLKR